MPINIRKLSVGSESVESLQAWQQENKKIRDGQIWHITRNWPKRRDELLDGGSIYWIIKGVMQARQRIVGFMEDEASAMQIAQNSEAINKKPYCRIMLASELILTKPWPHRPFQGWRYLKPEDAPPDMNSNINDEDEMPLGMAADLKNMGLI